MDTLDGLSFAETGMRGATAPQGRKNPAFVLGFVRRATE